MLVYQILRAAVVGLALLMLAPAASFAQSSTAPCTPPELVGDLGFSSTQCTGCFITGKLMPGYPTIEFATEPVLLGIKKGGPADGKLEEQDVLVKIDGYLITTRDGAIRYSWPAPGKLVRLVVRRGGILREVDIVPGARCRTLTQGGALAPLGFPSLSVAGSATPAPITPGRGWFGVDLSCAMCGLVLQTPGVSFGSYPEVTRVIADSPAEKAGLKAGDMLINADGLSLKSLDGTNVFRLVKPNQKVVLQVVRDGEVLKVVIIAGPPR
jgi:predicted metalloprotease with PDZ domain